MMQAMHLRFECWRTKLQVQHEQIAAWRPSEARGWRHWGSAKCVRRGAPASLGAAVPRCSNERIPLAPINTYLSHIFPGYVRVLAKLQWTSGWERVRVRDLGVEPWGSSMDPRHTAAPHPFRLRGTTFDILYIFVFLAFSFLERRVPISISNISIQYFEIFLWDLRFMIAATTQCRRI